MGNIEEDITNALDFIKISMEVTENFFQKEIHDGKITRESIVALAIGAAIITDLDSLEGEVINIKE